MNAGKVRVRVDSYQIQCWIDDKLACDVPREEKEFDIRYEMDQYVPLGVANFQCKSELEIFATEPQCQKSLQLKAVS